MMGVIDHFGSGGSQRQFIHLMNGLCKKGHKVSIFTYHKSQSFFEREINKERIKVESVEKKKIGWLGVVTSLVREIRQKKPDIVVSFLHIPNLLCECIRLVAGINFLIVSERTSRHHDHNFVTRKIRRIFHLCATKVVVNSNDHRTWISDNFPFLSTRLKCIYNGVEDEFFHVPKLEYSRDKIRFISVGRIDSNKNALVIAKAMILFVERNGWCPSFDWVGRLGHRDEDERYFRTVDDLIQSNNKVNASWRWQKEEKDILSILKNSHVLIHASRYEGLPNVICESLATGRPVIASRVCEHPKLIGVDGERGFLFDIDDPKSLTIEIERMLELNEVDWEILSERCRSFATANFGLQRMVDEFNIVMNASNE